MIYSRSAALLLVSYLVSSTFGLPVLKREVPQEHSHEKYLTSVRKLLALNNPDGIVDPVFGLLGNAAATNGLGKISDPDCLHQATADQAFTNAKAAGDVQGMTDALIFAALERNTGGVGVKSVLCTAIPATNPEIAAFTQIQDPASEGAAAGNKAITLELAKQISLVGGDPQLALEAGTFAPGQIGDPTGAGNTCDDANDPIGCIFTQNLLVPAATPEEIDAAVGGAAVPDAAATETAVDGVATETAVATDVATDVAATATACPTAAVTVTVTVDAAATATAVETVPAVETPSVTSAAATPVETTPAVGGNLQKFPETLGNVAAPIVTANGAQFCVEGNACFGSLKSAIVRSCDVQNNKCANASNAAGQNKPFSVGDCNEQQGRCIAAAQSA